MEKDIEQEIREYVERVTFTTENGAVAHPVDFAEGLAALVRSRLEAFAEEIKSIRYDHEEDGITQLRDMTVLLNAFDDGESAGGDPVPCSEAIEEILARHTGRADEGGER